MAKCFPKPLKPKPFDSGSGLRAWSVGFGGQCIHNRQCLRQVHETLQERYEHDSCEEDDHSR